MKEIVLNEKTMEMAKQIEDAIRMNQQQLSVLYQTVIAQSGNDCKFTLSPDKTKLVEVEDKKDVEKV